jgi:hypothetical protein
VFSSVVEVAGVVDGADDSTCDEFKVEEDWPGATPLLLCPFVCSCRCKLSFFPCLVDGRLARLCNLLRKLGIAVMLRVTGMTGSTDAWE